MRRVAVVNGMRNLRADAKLCGQREDSVWDGNRLDAVGLDLDNTLGCIECALNWRICIGYSWPHSVSYVYWLRMSS